jgi:hypothetical protein
LISHKTQSEILIMRDFCNSFFAYLSYSRQRTFFIFNLFLVIFLFSQSFIHAQVSINSVTFTYLDQFSGFLGTNDPANWVTDNVGSDASLWQGTGTGTSTTGGKYSFGNSGIESSFDGSIGFLPSGNRAINAIIAFENNTGETITNVTVNYRAEHWRSALNGRNNGWAVSYRIDGGAPVPLNDLTYVAPNNIATGGGPHGSEDLEQSFSLTLGDGQIIEFIFFGDNGTGSGARQGVAIDNFEFIVNTFLPITLGYFTVSERDKGHLVEWTTLDELHNDYMSVEHSADGRHFDEIYRAQGAGTTHIEQYYSYLYEKPTPGVNYYRIKQVDYDGQYSYSEIRSVRHDAAGRFHISPSNTEGMLQVTTEMESYTLQVFNTAGQELRKWTGLSQDQTIYLDELKAGMYIIRATNGSEVHTERIVKL